jgi:hypothetical protein
MGSKINKKNYILTIVLNIFQDLPKKKSERILLANTNW